MGSATTAPPLLSKNAFPPAWRKLKDHDYLYIVRSRVVGTVELIAGRYVARGCSKGWQDVYLFTHDTPHGAKRAVEHWAT